MRRVLLFALVAALVAAPVATATTRAQAIALVQHVLTKHEAACHMVVKGVTAKAVGSAWRVTARVVTFGNTGSASWWVQKRSGRVTPAEPLAADIAVGCPGG